MYQQVPGRLCCRLSRPLEMSPNLSPARLYRKIANSPDRFFAESKCHVRLIPDDPGLPLFAAL